MDALNNAVDYGIIGLLLALSVWSVAIAIERWLYYRRIDLAQFAPFSPAQRTYVDWLTGNWNLDRSPTTVLFDFFTRLVSPYEGNPANLNGLRHLLAERIDLAKVRNCHPLKLFVSATSVRTGKGRVFQGPENTLDAIGPLWR